MVAKEIVTRCNRDWDRENCGTSTTLALINLHLLCQRIAKAKSLEKRIELAAEADSHCGRAWVCAIYFFGTGIEESVCDALSELMHGRPDVARGVLEDALRAK